MKIPSFLNLSYVLKNLQKVSNQKFILKIIALLLAIITWLYVHGEIRKRPTVMPMNNSQNDNY